MAKRLASFESAHTKHPAVEEHPNAEEVIDIEEIELRKQVEEEPKPVVKKAVPFQYGGKGGRPRKRPASELVALSSVPFPQQEYY